MSDINANTPREDRILRRERSYKVASFGAVTLCFLSLMVFVGSFIETAPDNPRYYAFNAIWFWALVASYAQARLSHIDTIRRYRGLGAR